MPKSLFIFAEIKPKSEHFEEAKKAIVSILTQTRAEEGCRSFNLFNSPDQSTLYLFEEWDDQTALDEHYAKPYIIEVFKAYEDWLTVPPRILPLDSVR